MRSQFNTHRLLLFSELRSSPFSAGTLKKKKKNNLKKNPTLCSQLIRNELGCQCNSKAVEILIKALWEGGARKGIKEVMFQIPWLQLTRKEASCITSLWILH